MNRKFFLAAATVTALTLTAGVSQASAKTPDTAEVACKKAVLWASPEAGANSVSAPTRYDVIYRLQGGSGTDIGPRNGGSFDAFFCNTTDRQGFYEIKGEGHPSEARVLSCYLLRNIPSLTIRGEKDWSACVWVRYRD